MGGSGEDAVLGVDGCRGGWVGVVLVPGAVPRTEFAPCVAGLVAAVRGAIPLRVVGIDIPIGLSDTGPREADVLARRAVGPRRSSVFVTPVRAALEAGSQAVASERNARATGERVSAQAYALRRRILEVDRWRRGAPERVCEVHPEVSFATLAGRALRQRKATWAGMHQRRALLASAGIDLPADLGPAGERAGVDDVLDAAVVAWSARRVAMGVARSLPDPPQPLPDGALSAIWA